MQEFLGEEESKREMYQLRGCGHVHERKVLKHLWEQQIFETDKIEFKCPAPKPSSGFAPAAKCG